MNYSLESIKRELALQKERLQKRKSIGQIFNELMIEKGIESPHTFTKEPALVVVTGQS